MSHNRYDQMLSKRACTGSIDDLPDELLDLTLDLCSIESLKALRLTNKRLNRIATPYAFEHHHLGLFASSIDRLLQISRSLLAKRIRKLTFHSDVLPDWSRNDWESHIDQRPPFSEWLDQTGSLYQPGGRLYALEVYNEVPRHQLLPRELDRGWAAYQTKKQEQAACKSDIHGLVLKECLSSLPVLNEVIIGKAKPFSGLVNDKPYWKPLTKQILVSPESWFYAPTSTPPSELEGLGALLFLEAVGHRASFSGVKHVWTMKLDMTFHFSFHKTMEITYGDTVNNALCHTSRFETIKDALRPVRDLEVLAPFASDAWPRRDFYQAAEIHDLLLSARELRVLDLSYGDAEKKEYDDYRQQFGLLPLFSVREVLWPHITSLSLTASVPSQAFADFLALQAKTLRRLNMRDNVSDDWQTVLKSIPRRLKLESVYLECLWQYDPSPYGWADGEYKCFLTDGTEVESEENKALKAFLLHGQGELKLFAEEDSDNEYQDDTGDTTDEYDIAAW